MLYRKYFAKFKLKDIADPNDPAIDEFDCMLMTAYVGE